MKRFFLITTIFFGITAKAASYICITSPDVPNKFYEYEEGDDGITLYEMKLDINAFEYVDNHPREHSFNTEKDVTIIGNYEFLKKESARELLAIDKNAFTTLQATEPKNLTYQPKKLKKNKDGSPLIFAGQKVSKVYFIVCGKD